MKFHPSPWLHHCTSGGGRYLLMGVQTFSKGPQKACAPVARAPIPFFYHVVFSDIGAFLTRIRFHHNSHSLVTMQCQLKRSPLNTATLPPEVIIRQGFRDIEQQIVAHPEELRRNR